MQQKILNRKVIELNSSQQKMVMSGWGKDVFENTVVEQITYLSDDLKVKGYLAYPKNSGKDEKFPCIIWNRGGYENKGAIDHFNAKGIYGQIASWGYVVFASQYRGNAGGEGKEEIGGKDVNDIINLIPLADEIPFADKNNWGIEGWSRGGMMTFLTLLKNPSFKCAVLSGAISNFKNIAHSSKKSEAYYKKIIGTKNFEKEIKNRSAISFVEKLPNIPYLLMHGSADDMVPADQSIELAKKFQEMNYQFRLIIFENGDHYLKSFRKEVDKQRKRWFDKYLKQK